MIRFFRSGFPTQFITILLTGAILWAGALFHPTPMPLLVGFAPFYQFIQGSLSQLPILASILGFLLVAASALMFNHLLTRHDVLQKNSTIGGFIFIICMSFHPLLLTLTPGNISVFILLLILDHLFLSFSREDPYDLVYSAGFFSAAGSFFYFPLLFFYGFILFSFIFIRAANWREWVASLLGLLTPFIFLAVYYFWYDELGIKWIEYSNSILVTLPHHLNDHTFFILSGISIGLFSIYSMANGFRRTTERTTEIRRKTILLNWIIFFAIGSLVFANGTIIYHVEILLIPFSGLISIYLIHLKKYFWQEILVLVFLIILILNNLVFRFY